MRARLLVGALALTFGIASLASYALAVNDPQRPAVPSVAPATQESKRLAGEYLCRGVVGDKTYELTLLLQPQGDAYHLRWMDGDAVSMEGLAIQSDGYLSAAIVSRRGSIGVAIYKITGPVLAGSWTGGDGNIFPEVCRRRAMGA